MLPADHQAAVRRVLDLGRRGDPAGMTELIGMLRLPSNEVQRLAASAIGKLAEFGADAEAAVTALTPLALKARHPQTKQYKMSMYKKQILCQQEGKKLVSVYPADLSRLGMLLGAKLQLYGYAVGNGEVPK